jgi:cyanophycinase
MSNSMIGEPVSPHVLHKTIKRILSLFVPIGGCVVALLGVELAFSANNQPVPKGAIVASLPRAGGALVICGGGALPSEVGDRFVELAGGSKARIVVIPTAHAAADTSLPTNEIEMWKKRGVASVLTFHTRSKDQANDSAYIKPLTEATGVWFTGGRQNLLTEAYLDTEVERQLKALLDRGGVIGGSSAGAAVMTRIMITGGRNEASEGRGFDLLPGSVVDQHFMKRNRVGRLLGLLTKHPGVLGFGIDEQTALVVQGSHYSVIGNSYVMACVPGSTGQPARLEFLKKGDQVDLTSLRTSELAVSSAIDLDELLQAQNSQ